MVQGQENIELEVLHEHTSSFINAITQVTPLANQLHEIALIDRYTYNEVTERASGLSLLDKATELIKVLEKTISVLTNAEKRQKKFEQILSIFSKFVPLKYAAEEAKEAYGEEIVLKTLLLVEFQSV